MTDARSADELLARLAAAIERDVTEVPGDLTEVAADAARWAVVDEELAAIVDAQPAVATRASDGSGAVAFTAAPYEIRLSLLDGTLVGEIVPPPGSDVAIETLAATHSAAVDERGRFRAPSTAVPYRVRFRAGDRRITTPWVTR